MGVTRNIGKNTLGDNGKMSVHMHDYEMSSHDLSFVFRSSIAPGVLVPFMKLYAQKGDTFDISLNNKTLTHPTIGPLFGTFKLQHFVFSCPIRLYNSWLHNNKLGIGLKMSDIKLPKMKIEAKETGPNKEFKTSSSSLVNYMGFKGARTSVKETAMRNAVPIAAYYDIFKNYFANTQEKNFYIVCISEIPTLSFAEQNNPFSMKMVEPVKGIADVYGTPLSYNTPYQIDTKTFPPITESTTVTASENKPDNLTWEQIWETTSVTVVYGEPNKNLIKSGKMSELTDIYNTNTIRLTKLDSFLGNAQPAGLAYLYNTTLEENYVNLKPFPLEEIDKLREMILATPGNQKFDLNQEDLTFIQASQKAVQAPMGGLCVKTYDSDLFNNWINTDYIDGTGGINEASAVTIQDGKLTMDALNLAQKVYNFLNRIAVSGGTYRDWLETAFTAGSYINRPETPIFEGGMTQLIQFDEVVSNSASNQSGEYEPLGTLAGRGKDTQQKGSGKMHIKVAEPSYLIGLMAITPLVDYSQGNEWDITEIDNMDDWHKPALDGIGFQESLNQQRAWFTASIGNDGINGNNTSAGKTVAWINYMTNYNKTFGSFAAGESEDFMVLNREYEKDDTSRNIKDLTTYIDPTKYNRIFADTSLEAMNFWTQTACNITKRGNYSAKKIPNL